MKKQTIIVLIVALLLAAVLPWNAFAGGKTTFADVPDSFWASSYINRAAENGWISGFADGTFRPDAPVTYAQWLAMLGNLYYPEQIKRAQSGGYWYDQAVNASRDEGILASTVMLELWGGGKPVHGNGADKTICRYEMAKTISNLSYYLYKNRTERLVKEAAPHAGFSDVRLCQIYGYYRNYYSEVDLCASLGILSGKGNGLFDGEAPVKRSEAAAVLCKLADTFISNPYRTDESGNVIDPYANTDPNRTYFPKKDVAWETLADGKYGPENQYAAYSRPESVPEDVWNRLLWIQAKDRKEYCTPYVEYVDLGGGSASSRFEWQKMLYDYARGEIRCLSVPDGSNHVDWDFTNILDAYDHVGSRYGISQNSSDYDKVYAIHSYLSCEYTYNYALMIGSVSTGDMPMPRMINYSIDKKSTICQGFAEVMQVLCRMYGVDSMVMIGDDHAWNLVKVNGSWYHCDSCWDCCTNREGTEYTYFLLGDAQISKFDNHHSWADDDGNDVPACPCSYAERTGITAKSPDGEKTVSLEERQYHKSEDYEDVLDEELRLINAERAKVGAGPLKPGDWLMFTADFEAQNQFEYSGNYRGTAMNIDVPYAGYYDHITEVWAENLYRGTGDVREMLSNVLASPECREQLLNPKFTEVGLGLVSGIDLSGEVVYYWIQFFSGDAVGDAVPVRPVDVKFKPDTDGLDVSPTMKAVLDDISISYEVDYFTFAGILEDNTILYEVRMKPGESVSTSACPFKIYGKDARSSIVVMYKPIEGDAVHKERSTIVADKRGDAYQTMSLLVYAGSEKSPEIAFARLHIIVE